MHEFQKTARPIAKGEPSCSHSLITVGGTLWPPREFAVLGGVSCLWWKYAGLQGLYQPHGVTTSAQTGRHGVIVTYHAIAPILSDILHAPLCIVRTGDDVTTFRE